jgi:hypothetical protein
VPAAPFAPPQDRYAAPPAQAQPAPAQYAPPPQYPPPPQAQPAPAQYAPPPQYPPPAQAQPAPAQYAPPPQYASPPQYTPSPAYTPRQPPPPPYQPRRQQRDSWYIGFGLGGGDGRVKTSLGSMSFEEYLLLSPTTVALNFKIGATITPRLLLGFDMSGVSAVGTQGATEASVTIVNYDAMATFFPAERGFFLRGGLGLSRFTLDVTDHPGFIPSTFTAEASGTNVVAGAGYAFWLGRTFNLTVNVDYSAQFWEDNVGPLAPQDSSYWALGVGFDWY